MSVPIESTEIHVKLDKVSINCDFCAISLSWQNNYYPINLFLCRYQLICRSPVFYAMLLGDLAETGNIVVNDIDPAAFKQMLM